MNLAVIVGVLGVGAVLRILLLAALPRFFIPGDPATYFAMAQGVLRSGVPRVDFVWNYSSLPAAISHVESYYEFAYAYLIAGAMAVFGSKPVVACAVSLVFGILAPISVFLTLRRFGTRVAGVAATLVALEPWSIYYSGVLMKEALVSVIVVVSIEGLRRILLAGRTPWRTGLSAAAIVLAASAFEYDILPIIAVATAIALFAVRRDALVPYLAVTAAVIGVALVASLASLGVPISGKAMIFMGHRLWTTEAHTHSTYASSVGLPRFLPLVYILGSLLNKWYVAIVVLAWIGSRWRELSRADVVLRWAFAACYLYFHGVPHHLWERDFIALLPVLAPLAAIAICRREPWAEPLTRWSAPFLAMPRGVLAAALIAGALVGVTGAYAFHVAGVFPARWMPWTVIGGTVVVAAMFVVLLRPLGFLFQVAAMRWALPVMSLGVVLAAYSQSLPWPWIYGNPQFPNYELQRAAREHGCELLLGLDARAPVMAGHPSEVQLYSGHPTVLLPVTHDLPTIEALRRRYGVRYLLTTEHELAPPVPEALALRPIARRLGYTLYEFPFDAAHVAGAVARPTQRRGPPQSAR
jgi:hypothetical protein